MVNLKGLKFDFELLGDVYRFLIYFLCFVLASQVSIVLPLLYRSLGSHTVDARVVQDNCKSVRVGYIGVRGIGHNYTVLDHAPCPAAREPLLKRRYQANSQEREDSI